MTIEHVHPFLDGGGAAGELMRSIDWRNNQLGAASTWPIALKQSTSMMLLNSFPVSICWGEDYIQLYNDAYRPILGTSKHPRAMGASARDSFIETWETIGPMFERVRKGEVITFQNLLVPLNRNGSLEPCYFDFCYSPIKDELGNVGGIIVVCMETTEKVLSLERLHISRENLLNTVRQAPIGMCILKAQPFAVEEVNERFLEIIGEDRAIFNDVLSWKAHDYITKYLQSMIVEVHDKGKTCRQSEYEITSIVTSENDTTYVDFVFEPIRDDEGNIESVMILATDVTDKVKARKDSEKDALRIQSLNEELAATNEELAAANEELTATIEHLATLNGKLHSTNKELTESQKRAETANNELRESEARLKLAIQFTQLGTWDYELTDDRLFLSEECRKIFGFADEALINFDIFLNCTYAPDRKSLETAFKQNVGTSNHQRFDISYRINRNDDKLLRWIKTQGTIYFDDTGKAKRYLATTLDISDSKLASDNSARLAAIVESSDDAIISKTLESVITSWNVSAERMFGYTAEEMIGETIYKLIPADRHDEEPQILARLKKGERVQHFETQRLTSEGHLIDVSLSISPLKDEEGKIIGLSKIARDITERKLDEQRKNDFIGMASHELKTPLTSLKAMLQILEVKFEQGDDEFTIGALAKSSQQVNRMVSIINGFLNISRFESGKMVIEKRKFNLADLINEVMNETIFSFATHNIHYAACAPVVIDADYDKISSVIINLISNAVKYSPQGSNIEINYLHQDNKVTVSVQDEGIGIKPEDQEKLFQRYYRIEGEHTRNISGFGIGLYLCMEIIRHHHGKIWLESEPNIGSTFYFELPTEKD